MFKKYILLILLPLTVWASEEEYIIDKSHFSIGFLVEHVGYAKTLGMFRDIDGSYIHDVENKKINDINIVINTHITFLKFDLGKFSLLIYLYFTKDRNTYL